MRRVPPVSNQADTRFPFSAVVRAESGVRLRDAIGEASARLRSVCAELTQNTADAPFVLCCSGSLLARLFIPRLGRLNADLPDLRLHLSAGDRKSTRLHSSH